MISVSRLLFDEIGPGDHLRYGHGGGPLAPASVARPIVVWNCTRRCNLRCIHCYADAKGGGESEMTTAEAKELIDQLADFGVPVLLFSGGEPLLREDFFTLAEYAAGKGIGLVLSTNGTHISPETARRLRNLAFREVGISLDGIGEKNDRFRGSRGAFDAALDGIRNAAAAGVRISLRVTLTRHNREEIPALFDLAEREGIERLCFYHLAYAGRGNDLRAADLTPAETRAAVDLICDRTADLYRRGLRKEVLLVANHADGVYLYLKAREKDPERAGRVLELLRINGGNNSGIRIGAVDERGDVHPDQFWRTLTLGNVRHRPFGEIWLDTSHPVMAGLKDRRGRLKGRCAACKYLELCNGNLRSRAEAVFDDMWAEDPACYLTDEEIGIPPSPRSSLPSPKEEQGESPLSPNLQLVAWEITKRCNLSCAHCRASADDTICEGELSTEECFRVIDEIAAIGKPILILTGGEPLLRPDVFEIGKYAASRGLRVVLGTNGTLITPKTAEAIKSVPIARIGVSLDFPSEELQDRFRGKAGAFAAAIAGIGEARRAGIPVQINSTITRMNAPHLDRLLTLALDLGAVAFHPFMLVPTGRGRGLAEAELPAEEYERILNWVYEKQRELGDRIFFKPTDAPHYQRIVAQRGAHSTPARRGHPGTLNALSRGCLAGIGFAFISHTGRVQGCGYLDVEAGNVRREPFARIWAHSPLFRHLRDLALLKGKCGACEFKRLCGGCRARAYERTGDYLESEPYCIYEPRAARVPIRDSGEK